MKILKRYEPGEYASFWGADPVYCHPPQLPTDGYMLYDFSACEHDKDWYIEFVKVIDRLLAMVNLRPETDPEKPEDLEGLKQLKEYVQGLI